MWYVVSEYILDAWFPHRFERQRFPSVHTGVNCCCTKAKDRDTTCNTHRIQFHGLKVSQSVTSVWERESKLTVRGITPTR